MWDLTKASAKEFVINSLGFFFESQDFKLRRTKHTGVEYYYKLSNGFDGIAIGFLDSFPGQKIRYSVYKRINEIERVLDEILQVTEPSRKIDKESLSLAFGVRTVNNLRSDSYMPEMLSKEDVKKACTLIEDFMLKTGFPMLERFNDIKELDREINGDNFWDDDWQMPFNLGGDFTVKRMIIARIANQGNFNKVVEKQYEWMDKWCIENNEPVIDKSDISRGTPYIVHYLENLNI